MITGLPTDTTRAYPSVFRGREGRTNAQILRYLALNGPSLIYSVAQYLSSVSDTRVHYPTVNRRMHELLRRGYLKMAGTRVTKAGMASDLYANTIRGEFAALAGIPDGSGGYSSEFSPQQLRQLLSASSQSAGSPLTLFHHLLQEGWHGSTLVEAELVPALIAGVRTGYISVDAPDETAISMGFASLVARRMTELLDEAGSSPASGNSPSRLLQVLMRTLDKTAGPPRQAGARTGSSATSQVPNWASELKVLLRLYSAGSR